MPTTEAQKRATYKYREKNPELRFRVTEEKREQIKSYCEANGMSVSEFVNKAVDSMLDANKK